MNPLPGKCEDINTVTSFCDCMQEEESIDPAADSFCKYADENKGKVTGENLAELKMALKDLEEDEEEGCCCEC